MKRTMAGAAVLLLAVGVAATLAVSVGGCTGDQMPMGCMGMMNMNHAGHHDEAGQTDAETPEASPHAPVASLANAR